MATLRNQTTAAGASPQAPAVVAVAGDFLLCVFTEKDGVSVTSASSSLDGALTQIKARAVSARGVYIYALWNVTDGTHTVTVTMTGAADIDVNVSTWFGMPSAGPVDATNANGGGATTTPNHGSVTPSASALIVAIYGDGAAHGGITPNDGTSALTISGSATAQRQYYQYKTGHTGAIDADCTTINSVTYDGVIAAFLESAGGSASPRRVMVGQAVTRASSW